MLFAVLRRVCIENRYFVLFNDAAKNEKKKRKRNRQPRQCPVCWELHPFSEIVFFPACSHGVCRECHRRWRSTGGRTCAMCGRFPLYLENREPLRKRSDLKNEE